MLHLPRPSIYPKIVNSTKNMGWNIISMATNGGSRYILNSSSLNFWGFPKSWGYRNTPLAGWFRMEKSYKKWRKAWATASLEALSPRSWGREWPGPWRNMVGSWGVHSDFIGISTFYGWNLRWNSGGIEWDVRCLVLRWCSGMFHGICVIYV
jgi:hypothetical protein